ncbi:MAG: M28 family peptidase [Planctomycetaceae bacterium]|nr:MAG: M28 family peptidase [Planctomycetaceae bacterium]
MPLFQVRLAFFLAFFAGLLQTGFSELVAGKPENTPQSEKSSRPDPKSLSKHVFTLAAPEMEGRGTPAGKQKAVDYLIEQFESLGLAPLFPDGQFIQEIPGPRAAGGRPTVVGRNLGAWLPGADPVLREEFVIISAHYDHLGIRDGQIYHGADDNAGSVAMMLETARIFAEAQNRPRRSLVFLSCDLEENLLWGSRWFVAHPPWPLAQVKLFVTAELIGRTLGDLPLPAVFVMGGEHSPGLRQLVDDAPCSSKLQVRHLGADLVGTRSDYGPFRGERVPFLFFSGGEHRDYHRPTDTAEKLDYDRVAHITEVVCGVCRTVADVDQPPRWNDAPEHTLDEVRTLEEITGLLLKLDDRARLAGKGRLSDSQRFTVSNVHQRTRQMLERKELDPAERPWLVRAAQLLLLTVF